MTKLIKIHKLKSDSHTTYIYIYLNTIYPNPIFFLPNYNGAAAGF